MPEYIVSDRSNRPSPSASERVAEAIRSWMFGLDMRPGERLGREEDLAERFGVSRPTLREALRLLSSAQLVRATKGPGGGIFVAATGEDSIGHTVTDAVAAMLAADRIDVRELLETRILLEVPLAGMAALRANDGDIAQLREVLAQADGGRASREALEAVDQLLHALIARIAGNRLAAALMQWVGDALQTPLHDLIEPAVVEQAMFEQHALIVRAIERGDPAAAERAMREHLVYLDDLVTVVRSAT
jgi:DNA-binding FadR family transcriptional regulator